MHLVPPFLALISGLSACGSAPSPSGTLLVAADIDETPVTMVVDAATGKGTPLKTALSGGVFPAAADPEGTHALLIGSVDGPEGHQETLAIVPLAGGEARALAPPAQAVRNPAWSPDGQWLVFESSIDSFRDLYKVQRDGTGLTRLTEAPHGSFEPAFSPDGHSIVFASSRDGNAELYVMRADGTGTRRLTNYPKDDMAPQFSPDGQQVLFLRQVGGSKILHKVPAVGGQPVAVRLPDHPVVVHGFAIDPTGRSLAVTEQTSARELQVVVLDLATGDVRATLGGPGVDEMPAFSPDGEWVVWSSPASGDTELWRARIDGSHAQQLTSRPGADWLPRWVK